MSLKRPVHDTARYQLLCNNSKAPRGLTQAGYFSGASRPSCQYLLVPVAEIEDNGAVPLSQLITFRNLGSFLGGMDGTCLG